MVDPGSIFTRENIVGDVRSALVGGAAGSIMGWLGGWLYALFFGTSAISYTVFPSEDGYAQPLSELVEHATAEDSTLRITFAPSDLSDIWICEYSELNGDSARQLLFDYLRQYSMCLTVAKIDKNSFRVQPSGDATRMSHGTAAWQCKCPTAN